MRYCPQLAAAVVLLLTGGGDCLCAAAPDAGQVQAWLAQLDDDDFARREEATERLHAAGDAAIEALAQGALSASPETAWRAGEALKRIAVSGNERTLDRVARALERVGKQGRSDTHRMVAEIRARQRQLRHDRAAAQIRSLGGGLAGGFGELEGVAMMMPVAMPAVAIDIAEPVPAAEPKEPPAEEPAVAGEATAKAEAAEVDEALPEAPAAKLSAALAEVAAAQERPAEEDRPREAEPADEVPPADEPAALDLDLPLGVVDAGFALVGDGGLVLGGFDAEAGEAVARAESLALDANWRGGDEGLAVLRDLPDVAVVSIQGAKLTDAALTHLAALPKLRSVNVRGTKFSAQALRKLHRARPSAYLFCQGEVMVGIHADTTGSCVLTGVYPGSGAHAAGLRQGDKVVAIDDLEVRDFSELTISVYARKVGERLKIEFERDGKRQMAHVELRARKAIEP